MNDTAPSQQYAALPWRLSHGVEILLITSRETKRWVIPKGWPVEGLVAVDCAALEAFEEAGVRGVVGEAPFGFFDYDKRLRDGGVKTCHVNVFALEVTELLEIWPEQLERSRRWFSAEEAALAVQEEGLAALIRIFAAQKAR